VSGEGQDRRFRVELKKGRKAEMPKRARPDMTAQELAESNKRKKGNVLDSAAYMRKRGAIPAAGPFTAEEDTLLDILKEDIGKREGKWQWSTMAKRWNVVHVKGTYQEVEYTVKERDSKALTNRDKFRTGQAAMQAAMQAVQLADAPLLEGAPVANHAEVHPEAVAHEEVAPEEVARQNLDRYCRFRNQNPKQGR
jgi:hypothetical protein